MPPKLNVEGLWITWITAAHGFAGCKVSTKQRLRGTVVEPRGVEPLTS